MLVIGLTRLAETYLVTVAEQAADRVRVVGLLGRSDRQTGRSMGAVPVLGVPQEIASVVATLETHGVLLDRIVVTVPFLALAPDAREALLRLEASSAIALQFLADDLITPRDSRRPDETPEPPDAAVSFEIAPDELARIARRRYWAVKRAFDAVAATVLLVLLSPVIAGVALTVAMTIGAPITFWQQRPGLGGAAFRIYKFRTMKAARAADGRELSDEERTAPVGVFLRRTRLDELPQLINILRGEMSFVGPRPLLPRDQSTAYRARLLVRPGLTGWAQVVGGRQVSAEDKAALDVWYVRNADLGLDFEIAMRTIPMILRGEQTDQALVRRAWRDLLQAGVVSGDGSRIAALRIEAAA